VHDASTVPVLNKHDRISHSQDLVQAGDGDDTTGIKITGANDASVINLGGGLGITYTDEQPPSAAELIGALLRRIDERGHAHRKLMFEPGRSLVGNAGLLLTEVLYLKPSHEADGKNFCIVDAAMNDLMRPAMYEAWMGIASCRLSDAKPVTYDVVGPVCESGDWLGRDRELAVQAGDLLAVLSAGAYGMSMASNYNTRGRAAEVMVSDGRAQLIRDREKSSELFHGEHLLPVQG
jgi:diaminopimelate decarboxylase